MSALSQFESMVERIVDTTVLGLLGAQLQPIEIAKRLIRELEAGKAIGTSSAIVPNDFTVSVNATDYQHFEKARGALEHELAEFVRATARERRYAMLGPVIVRLVVDEKSRRHGLRITSSVAEFGERDELGEPIQKTEKFVAVARTDHDVAAATPAARVSDWFLVSAVDGAAFPLVRDQITLGRALDNDVVLDDVRVSRYHASLSLSEDVLSIRDLESTNGTSVNGRRVSDSRLRRGDVVSLGGLELRLEAFKRMRSSRDS